MTESLNREVKSLADDFLERWCEIDILGASEEGFSQFDHRIGDLSPQKDERLNELATTTKYLISKCNIKNDNDQLCADVLGDYCDDLVEEYETKDFVRNINVITNPLDTIHSTCLNIDESDNESLTKRDAKIDEIPAALESYKKTFLYGLENDCLPSRRQVAHIAYNSALYANDPLFINTPAKNAFLSFGAFLTDEIISKCNEQDAVGIEQYIRSAKKHLGKEIDVYETYEWGWEEIHSLYKEADDLIKIISPGSTYKQTVKMLESDMSITAQSPQELQEFLQNLLDESVKELDGKHFDIDPRLKNIEACLIDESGSSAMYYSTPSDDFSRPGRTYYPVNGKKRFPLFEEVTTCYHEGLPGHHLHLGYIKCLDDSLSKFQRTLAFNTGEGEGWALYAERLMVELGLNNEPAYILGMINASLFRAIRVVMDIGLHCDFEIPRDAPEIFPRREKWNADNAVFILTRILGLDDAYAKDEVYRYLGWIGQAIAYKVGEKTILDIRESQKQKLGNDFILKDFHSQLLNYGHVGLGRLEKLFNQD